MSLILRCINNGVVQENFISFINCHAYTYSQNKILDSSEDGIQEDAAVIRGNTIYI